ncbi:lipocalin family protein [Flavobacterium sp. j3]|uniref:Lipocalin family protein n=1 Tax=Flavobacterium aureirubrum TaxID=3133147 RepID=A0ABU9N4U9_9FLAO
MMKKIILFVALSVTLSACKSNSATNTSVDNKTERGIKGNWEITSVTYPGSNVIKVTSFDLADSNCFVGSKWNFISNNNKGNMSLTNAKCTSYSTPISWFINKEGQFVMKILDDSKAKTVKTGYVLNVANQSENSFQLTEKINVAGKSVDVVYQFEKLN